MGDAIEVDGREHYRTGEVILVGPYDHSTDVIFPCMVTNDVAAVTFDSGGAVLDNGRPAGVISRDIAGYLSNTPRAEALDNLGLALCTTPDCDVSPDGDS